MTTKPEARPKPATRIVANTLRRAPIVAGAVEALEGRNQCQDAAANGDRRELHRRSSPHREREARIAGTQPRVTESRAQPGNDGAEERIQSESEVSPTLHKPIISSAKGGRTSHSPKAPTTKAPGKVDSKKQMFFSTTALKAGEEASQARTRRSWLRPVAQGHQTNDGNPSAAIGRGPNHFPEFEAHLATEPALYLKFVSGM